MILVLLGLGYVYKSLAMLKVDLINDTNMIPFAVISILPGVLCLWIGCITFVKMNSQRIHWMCIALSTSIWPIMVANLVNHCGALGKPSVFGLCAFVSLLVYTFTTWRFLRYARKHQSNKRRTWRQILIFLYTFLFIFVVQSVVMDLLPRDVERFQKYRMIFFLASFAISVIVYKVTQADRKMRNDHKAIFYGRF